MNVKLKYRQKMQELTEVKNQIDRGNKSPALVSQMEDLLMEIESLSILGQQSDRAMSHQSGEYPKRSTSDGPFSSLGEQLRAIVDTSSGTKPIDERLLHIDAEYRTATGLSGSLPSEGEFLIQSDFRQDILTNVWGEGEIMRRCRQIPITVGNSLKWPFTDESARTTGNRRGSLRGYWVDQATEQTASKPKFGQHSLTLHKCAVLVYCTDEILEDSRALEEYIRVEGANEIKFMVEDAIINGSGAGMPRGLLQSPCKVTVDKEAG